MKQLFTFIALLLGVVSVQAQIFSEQVQSGKLGETRTLRIYVPENYTEEKVYPLIVVLDAEYLFDPVASNVKYYNYWDEMPEAIVVGVTQNYDGLRKADTEYDAENGLPANKGNSFFEFIGMELVPYIESKYTIANFKAIVGHGITANYINYFLLKEKPLFDAYINLSPEFAPMMESRVAAQLAKFEDKKFYYLATAQNDFKDNINKVQAYDEQLKNINNSNLHYYYNFFDDANHNSLAVYAIPAALDRIFSVYKPITPLEYKEKILTLETPAIEYLEDKYNTIEELFGLDKQISINDIMAIYSAARRKEDWRSVEELGELCKKEYPDTMLGYYFLAESLEKTDHMKQAMKMYQNAFLMQEIDFLTKDMMLDKANDIKREYGF